MNIYSILSDEQALWYRKIGKFLLATGDSSNYYFDFRGPLLNKDANLSNLINNYIRLNFNVRNTLFIGTGIGGATFLSTINSVYPCALWNPKGHGLDWSGIIDLSKDVVIVDDVCTTGSSIRKLHNVIIQKFNKEPLRAVVLYNRGGAAEI